MKSPHGGIWFALVIFLLSFATLGAAGDGGVVSAWRFSGTITSAGLLPSSPAGANPFPDLVPGMPFLGQLVYDAAAPLVATTESQRAYGVSASPALEIQVGERSFISDWLAYQVPALGEAGRILLYAGLGAHTPARDIEFLSSLRPALPMPLTGALPATLESSWTMDDWGIRADTGPGLGVQWAIHGDVSDFEPVPFPHPDVPPAPVPEPGTLVLLAAGLAGAVLLRRGSRS